MRSILFGLALLLTAFSIPVTGHVARPHLAWYACRITLNAHGRPAERACHTIPMVRHHRRVTGWTIRRTRIAPRTIRSVRYPRFGTHVPTRPAGHTGDDLTAGRSLSGYQATWEVTFYDDYGLMADGNYVHSGATACGYDVPLGARVSVPGVGLLTCEDREGPTGNPWQHADVWEPSGFAQKLAPAQ